MKNDLYTWMRHSEKNESPVLGIVTAIIFLGVMFIWMVALIK